jgi:cytochrome c biogenesis protein CcmG/thiol:disulfide interchange protein DsbE
VRRACVSFVLGMMMLTGCDRGAHPTNIAKPAPQFVLNDGTRTVDLSKLRGKVVLLNLWATSCAPCIEELPSLLALKRQMPDLEIVAVSWDEDPDVYHHFLTKYHIELNTVRDEKRTVGELYGTAQIPETYVIDRQGNIRRKFVSAQNWTSPEIMDYLKRL